MKEYKTIKEILDDLINREIGKSEAEEAIQKHKDASMLIMSVDSVRSIKDIASMQEKTFILLNTDIHYAEAELVFSKGMKLNITKAK